MSCPISSSSATVGLTALAILERLTTKRPLVNLSFNSPRKRYTEMLQLHIPTEQGILVSKSDD